MGNRFLYAALFFSAAMLAGTVGCTDKLFAEEEVSQFERYRVLRGESQPRFRRDPFGREEPALRERLVTPGR